MKAAFGFEAPVPKDIIDHNTKPLALRLRVCIRAFVRHARLQIVPTLFHIKFIVSK